MKYKILLFGNYSLTNVKINYLPDENLGFETLSYINNKWLTMLEDAKNKNASLYNSQLFRFVEFSEYKTDDQNSLVINVGDTDYKTYAALRLEEKLHKPNPIGTHIILVTSDGYIPLIKRSNEVEVNPGKIFTFGGFFDRATDWSNGKPNPFLCIQRETKEELGIDIDMNLIILIGIVYDIEIPHPEISFTAKISQTKEDISMLSGSEWRDLFFIKVSDLKEYLSTEPEDYFTPTLLGGLHLFTSID